MMPPAPSGTPERWLNAARRFYGAEAAAKDEPHRYRAFVSAYRRIAGWLDPAGGSVLDVGCGCGELLAALADRKGLRCGLDISSECLAIARKRNPEALFVLADAAALPFVGPFDSVVAVSSVEFCGDRPGVLREMRRVLRIGGRLYLEVRNADFPLLRLPAPAARFLVRRGMLKPYPLEGFSDLGAAEWAGALACAGFKVLHLLPACRPAWYGPPLTRFKNVLIRLVGLLLPVRRQYMMAFVCERAY